MPVRVDGAVRKKGRGLRVGHLVRWKHAPFEDAVDRRDLEATFNVVNLCANGRTVDGR